MSDWRQRRAEYRATGVPSARGGRDVGLSGSLPESERSGSPANGVESGIAVLFRCNADGDVRKGWRRSTGTSGKAMVVTKERLFSRSTAGHSSRATESI